MDKTCTTTYIITGEQLNIVRLHGRMLKLVNSKKPIIWTERYKTSLRCVAKLFFPDWIGFNSIGHFYDLQIVNERKIIFTVENKNYPEPELWQRICRKYGDCQCYYYARVPERGRYETNDEEGIHFPQRYLVIDSEDGQKAVIGQKDLFDTVCKYMKLEAFTSLSAFRKAVTLKINRLRIFDILVVDNKGNCITPSENLLRPIKR